MKNVLFVLLAIACTQDAPKVMETGGAEDTSDESGTTSTTTTGQTAERTDAYAMILELSETEADWRDLAYLSAIPATARLNEGAPAVIGVADYGNRGTATRDLLQRLAPKGAYVMGEDVNIPQAEATTSLSADNALDWSHEVAGVFWEDATHVVVVDPGDYSGALFGASLAARLDAPLLFGEATDGDRIEETASRLGAQSVTVGIERDPVALPFEHTALSGLDAGLAWVLEAGFDVNYLTVSNPLDRYSGRSQKASMTAPMYAALNDGLSLPVPLAMPTRVVVDGGDHPVFPFLNEIYEALGAPPEYLAIVGAHDALPQMRKPTIFDNPLEEQPVSDLPYGQIDDDPFLDLAIGRLVGDTVEELTSLATRNAQYRQLRDGNWENHIVESGLWGFDELRSLNDNVGFEPSQHLSQGAINDSRNLEIGAFLHKDHSYCQVLGNAVDIETTTLFAPAITLSRGCSVGGRDLLDDTQRSIVDHMLGRGMVAFVGAARNAIAYNTIIEVSLWNQLLDGQTLGRAFRHGINDAMVHWLDDNSSAMRYAIDTEIVYGDPAFRLHVPGPYQTTPANQSFDGETLTVNAPEAWTLVQYHPEMLAEWSFEGDLYMYTAPGAIPKTYWSGSHDDEDMYFGVQLPLDAAPERVSETGDYLPPLGWGGGHHIDHHADGSVTALWRVRLLDFDPYTGDILRQRNRFDYSVE